MLPASVVAKEFLHCDVVLIQKVTSNNTDKHINISCIGCSQLGFLFCTLKVDILQNVQWHGGAVFNIMYFLYCSIHCTFYC